jgi:regulator of sigma E protease
VETDLPLLIISFVLVLVPLIIAHEFGHFVMAKLVGITVLEFGIGFPPRIARLFKRGDTEYTLNWIPLGGFVRPLGEDMVRPLTEEEAAEDRKALAESRPGETRRPGVAVNDVSPLRRILFMVGGPIFNLLLAAALFSATVMIGVPVIDHSDIVVVGLGWDSPALRAGVRPGDVIRAVNGQPLNFASDLEESLAEHPDGPITLTVERAGRQLGFTLAAEAQWSAEIADAGTVTISEVNPGSPAEAAGLQAGDVMLAGHIETPFPAPSLGVARIGDPGALAVRDLNYAPVYSSTDISRYVWSWMGVPVTLTIERDGAPRQLTIATRANPPAEEGPTGIVLQTRFPTAMVREPLPQALVSGVDYTLGLVGLVITAPVQILSGQRSVEEVRPVGPVGISQLGSEFIKESVEMNAPYPILQFAGAISVALGLTNLLPLPALDGGRILFVLIEIIRGKRMDPAREGIIHLIGLAALLLLMVVLVIADISNPVSLP